MNQPPQLLLAYAHCCPAESPVLDLLDPERHLRALRPPDLVHTFAS